MRTFTTEFVTEALDILATGRGNLWMGAGEAENVLECCEDLADALAAGVTGSLLEAYVTACATGIPVEYVLPCEVSVLSCAPLECLTARDANPASR